MKQFITIAILAILCIEYSCSNQTDNEFPSDVLLRVKIGEKYGFINENGNIVIEPQFDNAFFYFSDGVCFAELDGRKGLINYNGDFILELPDTVYWIYNFTNRKAIVRFNNGDENIIDTDGRLLLVNNYKDINTNVDENSIYYALYDNDSRWSVADSLGNLIGEPCDSLLGFFQNLCAVKFNGKWGYMNPSGDLMIDTIYQFARVFSEDGIARVRKDSADYYIDKSGVPLLKVDKFITGFECNRAAIKVDNKFQLIDKLGNKICYLNADEVFSFSTQDSLATIIRNGKSIKIDTEGREILSTKYDNIGAFVNGVAPVVKKSKYGFISKSKYGFISKDGKEIIPPVYDKVFYPMNGKTNFFYPKGDNINNSIIAVKNSEGICYYSSKGVLIGKDMGLPEATIPSYPSKEDFEKYFDAKISDLAPLEGVYYVTVKDYYEDRDNTSRFGLNDSRCQFYAIIKSSSSEEYWVYCADGSNGQWVNKFVRIGDSDNYAIVKIDKDIDYSSEGSMRLENSNSFGFRLERGHNSGYNFFVTYDFVRDYPPSSEMEKIQQAEWTGTGFAIADGYILTNYHVTSGAKKIQVRGINGDIDQSYKAAVVAFDKEHDLSIIRIVDKKFKSIGNIPYSIGKSFVEVGEDVIVLGYPMVSSMGTEIKFTEGSISSSSGYHGDKSMYQISAAVQPGNSGGPVFNGDGAVIGIVCGKHSDAENANYAIKISYLYSLLNSSKLGIEITDNQIKDKKTSKIVKKVKDFVYLIECNSN